MATDKYSQASEDDVILATENLDRIKLNIGDSVPRMTQNEILENVTADTDIIVFNTTTNNLEFWRGTSDVRIIA